MHMNVFWTYNGIKYINIFHITGVDKKQMSFMIMEITEIYKL